MLLVAYFFEQCNRTDNPVPDIRDFKKYRSPKGGSKVNRFTVLYQLVITKQCLNWGAGSASVFHICLTLNAKFSMLVLKTPQSCLPALSTVFQEHEFHKKRNLSQLQLLLKMSFKGGKNPKCEAGRQGTLPLGLSTLTWHLHLVAEEAQEGQTDPLGHSSHRNKKVNVFSWACAFFFLLNHTGKRGLLQWEEQIVCALPL